jgi:fumarate reductase subunit D
VSFPFVLVLFGLLLMLSRLDSLRANNRIAGQSHRKISCLVTIVIGLLCLSFFCGLLASVMDILLYVDNPPLTISIELK